MATRKNSVEIISEFRQLDYDLNSDIPIKDMDELLPGYYIEIGESIPNYSHMLQYAYMDEDGDEVDGELTPVIFPAFSVYKVEDTDLKNRKIVVTSNSSKFEIQEALLKNVIILPSDRIGSYENMGKVDSYVYYMVPDLTGDYATRNIESYIKGWNPDSHIEKYRQKAECQVSLVLRAIKIMYSITYLPGQRFEIRQRLDRYNYPENTVADIVVGMTIQNIKRLAPEKAMIEPHFLSYRYEVMNDSQGDGEVIAHLIMIIDFRLKPNYEEMGIPEIKWPRI